MVVPATPVNQPTAYAATSTDDNLVYLTPEVSTAFGEPLLRKKCAIQTRQNANQFVRMTMRDNSGNPIDLTQYSVADTSSSSSESESASGSSVKMRFREASLKDRTIYEISATVVEATAGIVLGEIPSQVMGACGIYLIEAGVVDTDDVLMFTDECYQYNQMSGWGAETDGQKGPPTVDDVRLSLRDNDFYENELLDNWGYGLVELSMAAVRAVQFWNDQPPPVAEYSTHTFPFRDIWLTGIQLFIFDMAEEHYRRNFFKQSAGGVTVDDMNRHREYKAAWQERFERFRQLVVHRKAVINMNRGYGALGSGYGYSNRSY